MLKRISVLLIIFMFLLVSLVYAIDQQVVMDIQGMTCEL